MGVECRTRAVLSVKYEDFAINYRYLEPNDPSLKNLLNDWKLILVGCLTLGLAPFTPEPHIWGKLRWVWGGANSMQAVDWFDLLFHGLPWILLLRLLLVRGLALVKKQQ